MSPPLPLPRDDGGAPWGAPQVISSGWGEKFPRILQGVRLELKAIVCPADGSHCWGVTGGGLVQVTRTFRGLSARLRRQGKAEYLGIFARVKGIAGVGLTRFKTPALTKEECNFT